MRNEDETSPRGNKDRKVGCEQVQCPLRKSRQVRRKPSKASLADVPLTRSHLAPSSTAGTAWDISRAQLHQWLSNVASK